MAKSIVILCDGTSNEIKSERTNVLRLFQTAIRSDDQLVFYDPGVGTVGAYSTWSRTWIKIKEVYGLAFGAGIDQNVLDAYQFLIDNWEKGDKIYLFGFSRGAYTARVLAGLVYTIGIVSKEQENLQRYALHTLKQASLNGDFENLGIYQDTLKREPIPIEFLGLWDTVSSVFMWANGWFRITNIGYSRRNASIKTVRHALAIDEKRRFFEHYDWLPNQPHTTYLPHMPEFDEGVKNRTFKDQDVKEVWFAGTHCDVGGGFQDAKSQVPKVAIEWLLGEAHKAKLKLDKPKLKSLLAMIPDDPMRQAPLYRSLRGFWLVVEIFPKWRKFEWDNPLSWFNFYIPLGKSRTVANWDAKDDAKLLVHESVKIRAENTGYNPANMPDLAGPDIEWEKTAAIK